MPNLSALSRGTQVLAAAGLLLLIDTFLPWQSIELPLELGDVSQNAWHGFWGVVMGLMVIVLLAWVIARIMDVRLPVEVPDGPVTLALGALIFLFALIKNLVDDYSTIWSYIGVLLAAAVAYGAWLRFQEAGGTIETLKASMPRQPGSTGTAGPAGTTPVQREPDVTPTTPAEPTTPQPPPAAQPAPPAQPAEPTRPAPAEPAQPSQPVPPDRPTSATSAPPSPQTTEPVTQTGPTPPGPPTPPREPSDETEAERRPPQPPSSSSDQS